MYHAGGGMARLTLTVEDRGHAIAYRDDPTVPHWPRLPIEVFEACRFTSLEEAEWEVFKLRWAWDELLALRYATDDPEATRVQVLG